MAETWVVLEPLDTVSVRDGRAFDAGRQSVAQHTLPSPATLAGAIGGAYRAAPGVGRADAAARGVLVPERIRGPVMVRWESAGRGRDPASDRSGRGQWRAWFPVPRDLVAGEAQPRGWRRLGVATDSGWLAGVAHDLDGVVATLPQDVDGTASPVSGWCDGSCLDTYLDGGVPERISQDLWQVERRVGLARTPDRTAAEGMFYSIEHLRPQPGVGFAAQCLGGPRAAFAGTVRFGGQGRGAQVHADATVVGMPQQLTEFPGGRMLLYLATPAVFPAGGWIPDLSAWPGVRLVTAAVGSPQVVTTATPRGDGTIDGGRLMWAAPAGSVYYLEFPDAATAADAGTTIHATGLAQDEDWMSPAGFGLAFTGRWQHL